MSFLSTVIVRTIFSSDRYARVLSSCGKTHTVTVAGRHSMRSLTLGGLNSRGCMSGFAYGMIGMLVPQVCEHTLTRVFVQKAAKQGARSRNVTLRVNLRPRVRGWTLVSTLKIPVVSFLIFIIIICAYVRMRVYLYVHLSICLSVLLSIYTSVLLSIYPSICLSIDMSVCPSICISICPSICICIYLCVCVCIYAYVYCICVLVLIL